MTDDGTRYDDRETALILRRAARLQHGEEGAGAAPGASLAELEAVARDAGVEARHVRRAAAELRARPPSGGGFLGAPTRLVVERTVEGEVPALAFDAVLETLRARTGYAGRAEFPGRGLAWRSDTARDDRRIAVTVAPLGGRTVIRGEISLESDALAVWSTLGLGVGGLGGVAGSAAAITLFPPALVLSLGWAGGAALLARRIYGRMARRQGAELAELVEAVASACAAGGDAPAALGSGGSA